MLALATACLLLLAPAGAAAGARGEREDAPTYIVVYGSAAEVDRERVAAGDNRVAADLGEAGLLVVRSRDPAGLAVLPGVVGVARDRVRVRAPDEPIVLADGPSPAGSGCASAAASCPRQWDLARMRVPDAWRVTRGSAAVTVAVLDSGLRSGHEEVGPNYDRAASRSFVQPNPDCPQDATTFASSEDFVGHGTWTATRVAGVDGRLMTGIAPRTRLVNVRVAGACGAGADSWVLAGMLYAHRVGARVLNMSLSGYLCADGVVPDSFYCATPEAVGDDPVVWRAYQRTVDYLRAHGTLAVAAAGNDHVRLDRRGRAAPGGSLAHAAPGPDPGNDLRGLSLVPGGVPGVVAAAATNRVTATTPGQTRFGQFGLGRRDQLAHYSSYGPRVDVAAPGGARAADVPLFDCLSAECARLRPSTPDASDNPGAFGAWGVVPGTATPCTTCYVYAQGTSMATAQASGVAALALAARPGLEPAGLARLLRRAVTTPLDPDATPPIATDPVRPTFNYDLDYGAPGIAARLFGGGVLDAARAVAGGPDGDRGVDDGAGEGDRP